MFVVVLALLFFGLWSFSSEAAAASTLVMTYAQAIDQGVTKFFTTGAARIAAATVKPATTSFGLLILFVGFAVWFGEIKNPAAVLKQLGKAAIILSVAFSSARYVGFIAENLYRFGDYLAQTVIGTQNAGVVPLLDETMDRGVAIAKAYAAQTAGWNPAEAVGIYLTATVIWAFTVLVCGVAAAIIIMTKVVLAILLAFGPLFIACLAFPWSRSFFFGWLGQSLNMSLTYAKVAITIDLMFSLWRAGLDVTLQAETAWAGLTPAVFGGAVTLTVLYFIPTIARGVTGGFHVDTGVVHGVARDVHRGARSAAARGPVMIGRMIGRLRGG